MKKLRVATIWLDGCSGCHMSLLDLDEAIVALAETIELVYGPLVDAQEFPHAVDVTLVEGAVGSQEDLDRIQEIRPRTTLLVAMGDCAVTGNVPAMRNGVPVSGLLRDVFGNTIPSEGVPSLLRHARPVREFVKVDVALPGCPPSPKAIAGVIAGVLDGKRAETVAAKFG